MNRSQRHRPSDALLLSIAILFSLVAMTATLPAAAVVTGDATPLPWTSSTFAEIGYSKSGTLTVDAGSQLASWSAWLGNRSGATGEVTITSPGSAWTTGGLTVGYQGSGALRVEAGGLVSSSGGDLGYYSDSTGEATITGAGSRWTNDGPDPWDDVSLHVGTQGSGKLMIADGGLVNNADGYLGHYSGSTGVATITGPGSKWSNSGELLVGNEGSGRLRVEAGGLVSSSGGRLGYYFGTTGEATITGSGSKWTNSSSLSIGISGSGTLCVDAGGLVSSYSSTMGYTSSGPGAATITGVGSQWINTEGLRVGYGGRGTLTITEGGEVSNAIGYLGRDLLSTGVATVTGTGSKWANGSWLYVGSYGGSGMLRVEAGGLVSSSRGRLGYYLSSTGEATITGSGSKWTIDGPNFLDGSLYLGEGSSGTLTITDGGLVSVGGDLRVDYYDTDADSFINMSTGGMLALKGDADDSLTQFLGLVGGTDAIRYWNDAIADWALLTGATLGDDYTLAYLTSGDLAGYTLLTVGTLPTAIPGDFDNDGDVDGRDFLAWQRNPSLGNLSDWQADYGTGALTGAVSVPEPSGLAVMLLASTLGLLARRHQCS